MAIYSDKFSSGWATLKLTVTREDYSIANNTSKLKCVLQITKNKSCSSFNLGGANISMTIAGSEIWTSKKFDLRNLSVGNTQTLTTQYITVKHNNDGTKAVTCKASFKSGVSLGSASISNTYTCGTIPRASIITSAADVRLGAPCSVKWTPKSTSFKYKLKFSLGDWSYTTAFITPRTTSAYTYTGYVIPCNTTILKEIPNNTIGAMKVTLYSYNSSDNIGSDSASFAVSVPTSVVPTMGNIKVKVNSIVDENVLLQNKNTITVSVSDCEPGAGSSIKKYRYYCLMNNKIIGDSGDTTKTSVKLGPFTNTGKITIKVVVADTRNRTASDTSNTIKCYPYTVPSFYSFDIDRIENPVYTDEEQEDGTVISKITSYTYDIKCRYSVKNFILDINQDNKPDNKLNLTVYYQPIGGEQEVLSSTTYTSIENKQVKESIKKNISEEVSYRVWAEVSDKYTSTPIQSEKKFIYASLRIINVKSDGSFDGTGIGIGQKAKNVKFVESAYDIATTEAVNNLDVFDGNGYWMTNANGDLEPAIYRNLNNSGSASNLWIGATRQGDFNGMEAKHFTGGSTYISAGDGSNIYTSKLNNNGERINYKILDAENHGKVLYAASDDYKSGTITLNDSAENYAYLEIFYLDNIYHNGKLLRSSMRVHDPNGRAISTTIIDPVDDATRLKIKSSYYIISGTSITKKNSTYVSITNSGTDVYIDGTSSSVDPSSHIRISKVLGYK